MVVFLTSSPTGSLDGFRVVDGLDEANGFVEHLREFWPETARVLIITADPENFEGNDAMREFFYGAITKMDLPVSELDVWDYRTEDVSAECLYSYDVIVLGGGHVPTQNMFFHELGLREKIQDFEGIVIGISAGSMNSADVVYAQPELEGESVDPDYERWLEGLALTDINIIPHFQQIRDNMLDGRRLIDDISCEDSYDNYFLALCDGSYLMSVDGEEEVFGEAYEITDGEIRRIQ